jgi:hypothetical protein
MARPATGRRPDSLFDNRYRYDYIYPRGRSGETLRAYDTQHGEQPVVIKRPALQDAPPMRAGQEVSILNEKRALERLSGHPVLTELRHTGSFRVGGQTHQYIAMDMAQGVTVEDMVLELAAHGERIPELEMLVIFDNLLDLLQAAHQHKIVYNDVDAKHLFWDRDAYRLKVIDWGNAVFLDMDGVPAHVSPSTDIFQTGQLIYFVMSGGHRLESGRIDPASDLGDDVPPRLKSILNRAAHPEIGQRYPDIAALRHDLTELRRPLEKERDALIERGRTRLSSASNQDQLEQLRETLQEALQLSPGYPPATGLLAEVESRLHQLAVQGDLDAVRIYMTSGNMRRATALLDEIAARAGDGEQPLLNFLLDVCELLQAQLILPLPAGLPPALDTLFQNDPPTAARLLVTTGESRPDARLQQYLIAERMTLHIPGVVLLRPHLVRLQDQLSRSSSPQQTVISAIMAALEDPKEPGIQSLLRTYQLVSEALTDLGKSVGADSDLPDSAESIASRAKRAADDIVDLLDVVMHNVLSDPSRAGNALWHATAIDPANPGFEALSNALNVFHAELDKLREFAPNSDGSDIAEFLAAAHAQLNGYTADVGDPRFQTIVRGVETAIAEWNRVTDFIAMGGRRPAFTACRQAAEAIRPLNVAIARWFDEYVHKIEDAPRVEYLSPNVSFGRAMSDGWESWDRGRGGEAQASGEKALGLATSESERRAARRLTDLSETLASWLSVDGPANAQRTDQTEERVTALMLPEEETIRRKFAEQMPSTQIYLKAMSKGIVEPMREASSAAVRALFLHYVLRGILALHEEKPDEANFWKEAATKTLNQARLHPAFLALDTAIIRRQLILDAVRALNSVKHTADLTEARQAVRAPIAAAQLEAADQAMRAIDDALRRWPDGEFRAARQLLDGAVERIAIAETAMGKELTPFKTWLQDLAASAEVLQQAKRSIEQAALVPADEPDPTVAEAHQKLVDITRRDLGETYTVQLRQWRDTYYAIRDMYMDESLSKDEKQRLFESHFASLFIDRQPALPIFRHWQSVIHLLADPKPEYEAQIAPELAPVKIHEEYAPVVTPNYMRSAAPGQEIELDEAAPAPDEIAPQTTREVGSKASPAIMIAAVAVLVLVGIGLGIVFLQGRGSQPPVPLTLDSPGGTSSGAILQPSNTSEPPTPTDPPTSTVPPTSTPPTLPPTITRAVPTETSSVPTPTGPVVAVPTPRASAEITLPAGGNVPGGVSTSSAIPLPTVPKEATGGDYDVLKDLETLPSTQALWDKDWFGPGGSGWQLGTNTLRAGGGPLVVRIGPEVLTPLYGVNAAVHLKRVDATIELVSYDKSLLPTGQVAFGMGVESLRNQRTAVQAMLVQTNVLALGIQGPSGRFTQRTQIPVTTVKVTLSIQRNADNTVTLYADNQPIGQTDAFYRITDPITVYLYAATGGIVLNVTSLKAHLE